MSSISEPLTPDGVVEKVLRRVEVAKVNLSQSSFGPPTAPYV